MEKDVEQDPIAQKEVSCKALKAGTHLNGVPVLDIGGNLLLGFDRDQILALVKKLKAASPADPNGPATPTPAPRPGSGTTQSL
jgi:hypothetical protein